MRGLDTNVVVRLIVDDNAGQRRLAQNLLSSSERLLLSSGVLLETEWVLRDVYELSRPEILRAFTSICATRNIVAAPAAVIAEALRLFAEGLDFADALHLAEADEHGATTFLTFDRQFAKRSKKAGSRVAVTPL